MKYYFKLLLATVVLCTGCVENKKVKIEEGPEIFTTLPAELDTFSSGSFVKINSVIGDNDGVHDVTLKITDTFGTSTQTIPNFINYTDTVFPITNSNSLYELRG